MSDPWWASAVIYQVYPRSFADANGDGIGDLAGIRERLDHLRGTDSSLGVDAIWLSPIYPSPLHDFGYDISDYTDVAPEYGTLDDLDALIAACHERGLRVLMDLVPCHTSIEHPWFVDARSSRQSPKRDWYIWADPAVDGGPPSNWEAAFGGSTWEWDATTQQYYLHSFYPEQPDLNWRNPEVAEAIGDVMRFWFDRGVDGFRVDAIFAAIKDDLFRDNPPDRRPHAIPGLGGDSGQDPLWSLNRPEVHDVIRHLRRVAIEFPGRVLVGEAYVPVEELAGYLGHGADDEFHLAFNFELLLSPWDHRHLMLAIERSEALHPAGIWPTYALSNHDQSRHATRWGPERARAAAFMLLTLRGVAVLYAGEEIGMVDADESELPDPPHDRAGRDGYRTPMQWDGSPTGGFTDGTPWLPLVDPASRSVEQQAGDPESLLSLYRRLIAARQASPALREGIHRSLFGVAPDVLAWLREADEERVLCLLNVGDDERRCDLGRLRIGSGTVVVATGDRSGTVALDGLQLQPREGLAIRL
ncbi:MAG TPA: alpha-amylase family glycosyl hydrolase [Candidatus Limnocylindrales bacterium]|nr:alpha-amylase family glycosyl hydrolase [Candidatus Limnocylindrales bacterium]